MCLKCFILSISASIFIAIQHPEAAVAVDCNDDDDTLNIVSYDIHMRFLKDSSIVLCAYKSAQLCAQRNYDKSKSAKLIFAYTHFC